VERKNVSIARIVAFETIEYVLSHSEAMADEVIDSLINRYGVKERDAALAFELTYGVLRNLSLLDYYLEPFLVRSTRHTPRSILNILRLGAYQKLKLARVPDFAIVNDSVEIARRAGNEQLAKLVNAVLRQFIKQKAYRSLPAKSRNPVRYCELKYSFPRWLVRYLRRRVGSEEAEQFMAESNKPAPIDIRVNTLKISVTQLRKRLKQMGFSSVEGMHYSPAGLRLINVRMPALRRAGILEQGLAVVQDQASQLIAYLLAPEPNTTIIDYCSAPGGKTTHIAELTGDKSRIIALDVTPQRLQLVEECCRRAGVSSVSIEILSAEVYERLKKHKADAVLVDAPCTSLGILRRHPEIRWKKNKTDIKRMAKLQQDICRKALALLKPGGIFVYSVCTITEEETTGVVEWLLKEYPELKVESAKDYLPRSGEEITTPEGFLQTYPHKHQTDAFFAVRLKA